MQRSSEGCSIAHKGPAYPEGAALTLDKTDFSTYKCILVAIITEKVKSRVVASKMLTRSSGGFKPEKQRVDHLSKCHAK